MSSKRELEKEIFEQIYRPEMAYEFKHIDKPDFWLVSQPYYNFGVEITELYENESSARLDKIKGYSGELLDGKQFRHKDDKKQIIIDQIKILDKNENLLSEEEAIIRKVPLIDAYRNYLINKINEKTEKAKKYNSDLDYYNLIINDRISALLNLNQERISDYLFTDDFIKSLLNCSFEEIFLITQIKKNTVSFPLKRILFLYHTYLFQEVITRLHKPSAQIKEEYYYSFMIEFLENQGFKNLKILKSQKDHEILFANTGFTVKNNTVKLMLYEKLNQNKFEESKNTKKHLSTEIKKIIKEEKSKFGFSCGLETIIE